ncbi:hypothetical protein [Ectopseudomonas mendocina]|nr:hypothetical protein [Pseudomonas mendocina]
MSVRPDSLLERWFAGASPIMAMAALATLMIASWFVTSPIRRPW